MEMMTNVAPVLNIRTITDKDEIIVDIYISLSESGKNYVLNAGCAVLALKTGSNLLQLGIPFANASDLEKIRKRIDNQLAEVFNFFRKERGYNQV